MKKTIILLVVLLLGTIGSLFAAEDDGPTPAALSNVALRKPSQASSDIGRYYTSSKAFDGSYNTRWASLENDPQWITVDLSSMHYIDRMVLYWYFLYAKVFEIRLSEDGVNWTTVYSDTQGDNGVDFINNLNDYARYVQLFCIEQNMGMGYSLYEIQVWGYELPVNQPPVADANGPYNVDEGGFVILAGSGFDPDEDPLTYTWDLDNDGTFETSDQNPTFSAVDRDGLDAQTVVLQVCDDANACDTDNATVTIDNVPPTAQFSNDGPVNEGSEFTLSFSDPYDPSSADVTAGFDYAFDCGDGSGYGAFGPAASANCPTSDNGQRSVWAKIKDKDGGESEYNGTVDINNVPPTASFINASGQVIEGEIALLAFSNQFDPSSADTAAGFLYAYDCTNDGAFEAEGVPEVSFACAYPVAGEFTALGRIADKNDGYTHYTILVTVLTPAEATQVLIEFVASLNLQQGIDNSLDTKLEAAIQALEDLNQNNDGAALNTLQAFINAVEAQKGKSLTDAQADALIDAAQAIINNLSAP